MTRAILAAVLVLTMTAAGGGAARAALTGTVMQSESLRKGVKSAVVVRLTHEDGMPVMPEELDSVHTKKMHLLAVEPQLSDYHHLHPVPMQKTFGNYIFFLTPGTDCQYRAWVDVTIRGKQELVAVDLPGAKDCAKEPIDKMLSDSYTTPDGYKFTWTLSEPLKAGGMAQATISVAGPDGKPFEEMQPILGAFMHLVGFYDDYKTILHTHPEGEEPTSPYDIDGPDLKFHIMPKQSGYVRLYAQCVINGKQYVIPFGMIVN